MATCPFSALPSGNPSKKSTTSTWSTLISGAWVMKSENPTTLATTMEALLQLDGMRGGPQQTAPGLRGQPLQQRLEASKRWASWAPGLKFALATAIEHLQVLELPNPATRPGNQSFGQSGGPASVRQFESPPEQPNEHFSVSHLKPDNLRPSDNRIESAGGYGQGSSQQPVQRR